MRRLLVALAAAALAATVAPAVSAAPSSWVHFVADGPAYGTFTLPHGITLDFPNAVYQTDSEYAVLVASDKLGIVAVDGKTPDPGHHSYAGRLPKGRVTIRLMTSGRTTIKVPSESVRRTTTFRLTKRLQYASATVRTVPLVTPNVTIDTIPIMIRTPSVVMHGFHTAGATTPLMPTALCVDGDETAPCRPSSRMSGGAYWYAATLPAEGGEKFAKLQSAVLGTFGTRRVHWVLVIPAWSA